MSQISSKNWIIGITIGISFAVLATSCMFVPGLRPRDWLLLRLKKDLSKLREPDLKARLRRMIHLSDEGLNAVIDQLDASQPKLALAGEAALHDALDRWRLEPPGHSSVKVEKLARELARRTPGFSSSGRRAAARLATRMLLWPVDAQAVNASQFLIDCEMALRSANPSSGESARLVDVAPPLAVEPKEQSVFWQSPLDPTWELPGGNLPVEIAKTPILPEPVLVDSPKSPLEPRRFDFSTDARPLPFDASSSLSFP